MSGSMIKITIEAGGQPLNEIDCDQFYLIASNGEKFTESMVCRSQFLAYVAMKVYEYAMEAIKDEADGKGGFNHV